MANFSPGLNFSLARGSELLFRLYDEFHPGLKILASAPNMKLRAKSLQGRFSVRAETPFLLHGIFSDFSVRLRAENLITIFLAGLGFSAQAELRPGLSPSSCNRQFDFL